MHPAMTADEIALFRSLLVCADRYVEFGTGGSSVLAAELVRETVISVDSSAEWLDKVRTACADKAVQPALIHVDIGPTREWSFPTDPATMPRWPNYHGNVWEVKGAENADIFMSDGRFRVACFMQALIRCRPDALLVIHDYPARPAYHVVEHFARPVARAGALVAFQRHMTWNPADAVALLLKHTFDPT